MPLKFSPWNFAAILSLGIWGSVAVCDAEPGDQEKAKATVTEAEKNSRRVAELSKQGIATSASVHRAEVDLAEARIRLAAIQGRHDDIVGNLEKLVTHREHLWKQARDLSEQGVGTVHTAGEARVELAEARIRLEAQTILSVHRQQFTLLEKAAKAGAVPQRSVDDARKALEDAHKRLGREKP